MNGKKTSTPIYRRPTQTKNPARSKWFTGLQSGDPDRLAKRVERKLGDKAIGGIQISRIMARMSGFVGAGREGISHSS